MSDTTDQSTDMSEVHIILPRLLGTRMYGEQMVPILVSGKTLVVHCDENLSAAQGSIDQLIATAQRRGAEAVAFVGVNHEGFLPSYAIASGGLRDFPVTVAD